MREEHKADVREREGRKKKIIIMAQELRSVNFPLLISLARSFLQSRPLRAEVGKPQELAPSWRLARGLRCGSPLLCVAAAPAAGPGSGGCIWWGLPGLLWCRPSAGPAPLRCRGPPGRLAGGGAVWDWGREPGGPGGPGRLFPGAASRWGWGGWLPAPSTAASTEDGGFLLTVVRLMAEAQAGLEGAEALLGLLGDTAVTELQRERVE